MRIEDILSQPFDISVHKKAFTNYLEVILCPDGTIQYAVPSHQEFLIHKAMELHGWTRSQLMEACPKNQYCDFLGWLVEESGGFVPVWIDFIYPWELNRKQLAAIRRLKMVGLYHGICPTLRAQRRASGREEEVCPRK